MDYEWSFLYGAVNPATGERFGLILPEVNLAMSQMFFERLSEHLGPDRHAVVVLDGAGWHGERCVAAAQNITLLVLPPYSPQLNPIERLWRWLKEHFIANTVFASLDALLDRLCEAWQSLTPERIKTVCRLAWIDDQN